MSDYLRPHGLQHARLPWPSLSPGVCSNSCPLSRRCHPTILSTVTSLSSCPQSFPGSASFPMSWLFIAGGQRTGASASVLPMKRAQSLGDTSFVRPSWSFTKHTILLMSLKGSAGKKYVELCHHFPCLFQPLSSSLKEWLFSWCRKICFEVQFIILFYLVVIWKIKTFSRQTKITVSSNKTLFPMKVFVNKICCTNNNLSDTLHFTSK